ncbi:hypothetical protein E2C01_064286 [Portunus trituberculatus]|uniref:Uncharacterized protein n=1 Tax=Portunus trituberculatus TaxID=210409 RepID=A0A5B7HJZ3_PORTR|nr:hypothetical protein [Portunus trituberculatus]
MSSTGLLLKDRIMHSSHSPLRHELHNDYPPLPTNNTTTTTTITTTTSLLSAVKDTNNARNEALK